jgi:hypothetical protein
MLISVPIIDKLVMPYRGVSDLYASILRFANAIRNIDIYDKFGYDIFTET